MSDLPAAISLREVGPRDGLQNEAPVPTEAKVELIDALSRTGVGRIEAVASCTRKAIPQMADADEVWAASPRSRRRPLLGAGAQPAGRRAGARRRRSREIEVVVSALATPTTARTSTARPTESLDDIAAIDRRSCTAQGATVPGDRVDRVGLPVRG